MGNTNYRRGRGLEYYVRDRLAEMGYVTLRSPASKGPADVVAMRPGEVYFVQCKVAGYMGVGEWNELMDYAERAGATPILATRGAGGRGVEYYRLTGRKDGTRRRQPMEAFSFEEAGNE